MVPFAPLGRCPCSVKPRPCVIPDVTCIILVHTTNTADKITTTKRKTTNAREKGTRRHATPPMLVAVMPRRPCWRGCAAVSLSLSASCVGAYLTIKMTKIAWFSKMAIYGLWSDLGRSFRIRLRRTIRAHWDAP